MNTPRQPEALRMMVYTESIGRERGERRGREEEEGGREREEGRRRKSLYHRLY